MISKLMLKHILIFMGLSILLAGCGNTSTPTDSPVEPDVITIQLSWIHEYSAAPFHVALNEGFFENNNLDVTLLEGGFGDAGFIDPVVQVIEENISFGLSDGSRLIEAQSSGQPVVAIGAVLQRSPLALLSLGENDIQQPPDLAGQTVMVADGGARMIFDTLLDAQEIDSSSLQIEPRVTFGIDPLLTGETDVLVGWIINEGVALEEAGQSVNSILMSDYGVDTYDFVLFTTEDMVANQPDIVQRFVDSIVQGIEFIVTNPQQAIEHTLSFNEALVAEEQLLRLEATIPLMNVPGTQIGGMDPEIWQFTYDLLRQQDVVDETFDISSVYTLDFVNTDSE